MEHSTLFKDPVCGMAVTARSFHVLEQDGERHYFCSARCKARFEARLRQARSSATPTWQQPAAALHRLPLQQRWMLPLALVTALVLVGLWLV